MDVCFSHIRIFSNSGLGVISPAIILPGHVFSSAVGVKSPPHDGVRGERWRSILKSRSAFRRSQKSFELTIAIAPALASFPAVRRILGNASLGINLPLLSATFETRSTIVHMRCKWTRELQRDCNLCLPEPLRLASLTSPCLHAHHFGRAQQKPGCFNR